MVQLQGGDARVIDDPKLLPQAKQTTEVKSEKSGYVAAMQCEQIGTACVILGGGRERKEDSVDPAVGIVLHKKVGDEVRAGELLFTIHYNSEARAQRAEQLITESCKISEVAPRTRPLVHRVIRKSGEAN
jgi:thymidine phosphorylase